MNSKYYYFPNGKPYVKDCKVCNATKQDQSQINEEVFNYTLFLLEWYLTYIIHASNYGYDKLTITDRFRKSGNAIT